MSQAEALQVLERECRWMSRAEIAILHSPINATTLANNLGKLTRIGFLERQITPNATKGGRVVLYRIRGGN